MERRIFDYSLMIIDGPLRENATEMVEEIGRKLDELRSLLEDIFLTTEECLLLKEIDEIVENKRFNELKSLDEIQNLSTKKDK